MQKQLVVTRFTRCVQYTQRIRDKLGLVNALAAEFVLRNSIYWPTLSQHHHHHHHH